MIKPILRLRGVDEADLVVPAFQGRVESWNDLNMFFPKAPQHLSHYFEVTGLLRGEPYFCHGIDVAYSTYLTARLRQELQTVEMPEAKKFDKDEWEASIRRVYGAKDNMTTADGIIALQKKLGWIYENNLPLYREKWSEIREVLADSPTPEQVLEMLGTVELNIKEFEKMYGEKKLTDGIRYAKDLKDRYTVLWMYEQVK